MEGALISRTACTLPLSMIPGFSFSVLEDGD
jgi:hypothetical protein